MATVVPQGSTVAILATALIGASACSSVSQAAAKSEPFTRNIAQWVLPLDAYMPNPRHQQYALNFLWAACMSAHGFNVAVVNPEDYAAPKQNAMNVSLFNVPLAMKYGYHTGPPRVASSTQKQVLPPSASGIDQQCSRDAAVSLHVDIVSINYVEGLASDADSRAQDDKSVRAAAERWHACMLPLGISDLPTDPMSMPSGSQRAAFGMDGRRTGPPLFTASSVDEIRQATFDARCRDTSGYSNALYESQIANELAAIRNNHDKLDRVLAAVHDENAQIVLVLRQHGH